MIILLFPYQILSILGQIPKTDKKFPYREIKKSSEFIRNSFAVRTGLEPVTPCVTGMYSNQLN